MTTTTTATTKTYRVQLIKLFNGEERQRSTHHVRNVRGLLNVLEENVPRSLGWGYALSMDAVTAKALGVVETQYGEHVIDVVFDDIRKAIRTVVDVR